MFVPFVKLSLWSVKNGKNYETIKGNIYIYTHEGGVKTSENMYTRLCKYVETLCGNYI